MRGSRSGFIDTHHFTLVDESTNAPVVGGNKIRKLSAILHSEPPAGLLTYGSRYSSHCAAAAYWAAEKGIPARVLILDDDPSSLDDAPAVRLCHRLAAQVVPVYSSDAHGRIAEEKLAHEGYRWIAGGGHELPGAEAYRDWFYELLEQVPELQEREWVALPLGTGTTALGIAQAIVDADLSLPVYGVSVSRDKRRCITALSEFSWNRAVDQIHVIDDFSGYYGQPLGDEKKASRKMLKATGVLPDPIYNVRVAQFVTRNQMTNGVIINTGGQHNYYLP